MAFFVINYRKSYNNVRRSSPRKKKDRKTLLINSFKNIKDDVIDVTNI